MSKLIRVKLLAAIVFVSSTAYADDFKIYGVGHLSADALDLI